MITKKNLEKAKIAVGSHLEVELLKGFDIDVKNGETVKLPKPFNYDIAVCGYLTKVCNDYIQLSASPDGRVNGGLSRSFKVYYSMVKSFQKSEPEL